MCMIGLCDNALLSNSTFGVCGVLFGKPKSLVVCPLLYVSPQSKYSALNNEWHPAEWIAL